MRPFPYIAGPLCGCPHKGGPANLHLGSTLGPLIFGNSPMNLLKKGSVPEARGSCD